MKEQYFNNYLLSILRNLCFLLRSFSLCVRMCGGFFLFRIHEWGQIQHQQFYKGTKFWVKLLTGSLTDGHRKKQFWRIFLFEFHMSENGSMFIIKPDQDFWSDYRREVDQTSHEILTYFVSVIFLILGVFFIKGLWSFQN